MLRMPLILLFLCAGFVQAASLRAMDTLVVAPKAFQPALEDWLAYRRTQGRSIQVVEPPSSLEELRRRVIRSAQSDELRYVVLVGDAPPRSRKADLRLPPVFVPIGYCPAVVNVAWGAAPDIATDNLLGDLNGDSAPELAVGRIPCREPGELREYLRRVVSRERKLEPSRSVTVVASPGRFSPLLDSLIELTAQQALKQLVPGDCPLCALHASPTSPHHPPSPFRQALLEGLRQECLARCAMAR